MKQLPLANDAFPCDKMVASLSCIESAALPTYLLGSPKCPLLTETSFFHVFQVAYGAFYFLSQTLSCSGPPLGVFCTPEVYS